jgi:tetratricopeptide (TPR) repeat protein
VVLVIVGVLGVLGGGPLGAQTDPVADPAAEAGAEPAIPETPTISVELSRTVRRDLREIQEQWLQWTAAFRADQEERGERLLDGLMAQVEQLGMRRFPDLAVGAAFRAVEAARDQDFPRAAWALAAAERFDPGRPETAFARSEVERLEGRLGAALVSELSGYRRIASLPSGRHLGGATLVLWALAAILGAGAIFVGLQMAVKGRSLMHDVEGMLERTPLGKPGGAAGAAVLKLGALAVLLWPLLLPSGLVWLLLWWSALLLGYGSPSERVVLVMLWLVAAGAPWVIEHERQRVDLGLSPPARALDNLETRRLYGGLFIDLDELLSAIPGDPAVEQLLADVHRGLGQWDLARRLYRKVLVAEPENSSALVALGGYYFIKRDYFNARRRFQRAAEVDPDNVTAFYNLHQTFSAMYQFEESAQALEQAQRIDDLEVSRLLEETGDQRIATFDGGIARAPEIHRRLAALDSLVPPLPDRAAGRWAKPLAVAAGLAFAAMGFAGLRRRWPTGPPPPEPPRREGLDRWLRALLPGLGSVRDQWGGRAFLAPLIPVALALLPLTALFAYPLGTRFGPPGTALVTLAAAGLAVYFGVRLWLELSSAA